MDNLKRILDQYEIILKTEKSQYWPSIQELDCWLWNDIPRFKVLEKQQGSNSYLNSNQCLNKSQLEKLMKWKLQRGKFRPRLQSLIASNSSELVKQCTFKAIHQFIEQHPFLLAPFDSNKFLSLFEKEQDSLQSVFDCILSSVKILCELKGVGPATASLILMSISDYVPFFSDESYHMLFSVSEYYRKNQTTEDSHAVSMDSYAINTKTGFPSSMASRLLLLTQPHGNAFTINFTKFPSLKYNVKEYRAFLSRIYLICEELLQGHSDNRSDSFPELKNKDDLFSPCCCPKQVEKALWTQFFLIRNGMNEQDDFVKEKDGSVLDQETKNDDSKSTEKVSVQNNRKKLKRQ